jgi:hypothetical protein
VICLRRPLPLCPPYLNRPYPIQQRIVDCAIIEILYITVILQNLYNWSHNKRLIWLLSIAFYKHCVVEKIPRFYDTLIKAYLEFLKPFSCLYSLDMTSNGDQLIDCSKKYFQAQVQIRLLLQQCLFSIY